MSPGLPRDPARLRSLRSILFWIGLGFAVATLGVVASSNTTLIARLERKTVPPSWILAGAAIGVLFAAEQCNSAALAAEQEPPVPQPEPQSQPEPERSLPLAAGGTQS